MKKIYSLLIVAALIVVSCQPKPQPVVVDLTTSKAEVNALMENIWSAWNAKDVNTLTSQFTEDGLFCGTDPTELWDKKQISNGWKQFFADSTMSFVFTVDKREIRVVSDGESALVMEQQISNPFTPKIQWRLVSHAVKTDNGWKLDFISWNMIPKNEDLGKINMALE
jgi:uncharacterized protein (TIGR02246 family)